MPRTYTPHIPAGERRPKASGRRKSTPSKSTIAIRQAVLHVFVDLQDLSGEAKGHVPSWAPVNDTTTYYVLNERLEPVECPKEEWKSFLASDGATVAMTHLGSQVTVTTIFTGVDFGFGELGETPCLFETMGIIRGEVDDLVAHRTWAEAEEGHRIRVQEMRRRLLPASIGR